MIEFIMIGVGVAAATAAAKVSLEKRLKSQFRTNRQFQRDFKKTFTDRAICIVCNSKVTEENTRIIFVNSEGQSRYVCDRTICVVRYSHSEPGNLQTALAV